MLIVTLLIVCAVGFAATLTMNLLSRLAHGASLSALAAGGFHEVVSARALCWLFHVLAWTANLLTLAILTLGGLALLFGQSRPPKLIVTVAAAALLAWPCYKLRKWFAEKVIHAARPNPPGVDIESTNVAVGIDPEELLRLGAERFPNHIDPGRAADTAIRWALLLGGIGLAILFLLLANQQSKGAGLPLIRSSDGLASAGLLLAYPAGVLLLMLLANNRDYTFVPFRLAVPIEGGLAAAVVLGALLMGANGQGLLIVVTAAAGAIAARAGADLRVSWVYSRIKRTLDPIADDIREQIPDLNMLAASANCRQPRLRIDALADRLARGCQNVEEKGAFVTRHFARFLDVVDVRTHDCMMAQLRFLTVRRYVTLTGGTGTYAALRYPQVREWNETLFPVHPPTGFVNWIDPLVLGSDWDVVVVCHRCGGSGQVKETYLETRFEYYTDLQGKYQKRTVYENKERWVTCSTCSGCGRLHHQQVLNTQWQRLQPTVTGPEMMLAELVEDADEVTFMHLPMNENRRVLPPALKAAMPPCPERDRLVRSAQALSARHLAHAATVEKLHDGTIYRADFRVCGFRTVRMAFRRLAGRIGWFFGRRPEFYFPRLPLSWAAVAVAVFLPPLAIALGLGVLALVALLLQTP